MCGMGRGVSHSITSGIRTIQQENVAKPMSKKSSSDSFPADDWEVIKEERTSMKKPNFDDNFYTNATSKDNADEGDEFFDAWDKPTSVEKSFTSQKPTRSAPVLVAPATEEAVKKFGNAKAISSQQFFSNGDEMDYETRSNLSKFEGQTSIGSSDLFGGGSSSANAGNSASYYSSYSEHVPEMADIKDSVKHGVSKVADKISNIGSSVSSYLSDRY